MPVIGITTEYATLSIPALAAAQLVSCTTNPTNCCPSSSASSTSSSSSGATESISDACTNCIVMPAVWLLETSNDFTSAGCIACSGLNNQVVTDRELLYTPGDPYPSWRGPHFSQVCAVGAEQGSVFWHFFCQAGVGWRLALENDIIAILIFDPVLDININCNDANLFSNPTWNFGTCSSTGPAVIYPG